MVSFANNEMMIAMVYEGASGVSNKRGGDQVCQFQTNVTVALL